ncbi:FadR family transcriptional regulator [Paracoccus sp. M683]|uniref:FadR/GntR family transcriptional regulator n=1 Tax=Paracoccus sp. M683 TaxID=2594268 RepID=UPI00117C9DF9|nr:FadR/GntR family transcriptional regulator [Paracoccus sp. M683]TRW95701.1 FadR family transcriptional regulator [Paracoccus sp. M683]
MARPTTEISDQAQQRPTLVVRVQDSLRARIADGQFAPGDRLPSEAQLTREFGVSRTVVREAIAALRSDGLVEPRQGAGVFVLEPPVTPALPFADLDLARVSSLIEMLELRAAVEGDAAGLAALRRSPAQEEVIVDAFDRLRRLAAEGQPTADADFAFHLAIADASNNPRFSELLRLLGTTLIPRRAANAGADPLVAPEYARVLDAEHEAILKAIQDGDETAARQAMRRHLKNSQARYREYLRALRR